MGTFEIGGQSKNSAFEHIFVHHISGFGVDEFLNELLCIVGQCLDGVVIHFLHRQFVGFQDFSNLFLELEIAQVASFVQIDAVIFGIFRNIDKSKWISGHNYFVPAIFDVIIYIESCFFEEIQNGVFIHFLFCVLFDCERPSFDVSAQHIEENRDFVGIVDYGRSG